GGERGQRPAAQHQVHLLRRAPAAGQVAVQPAHPGLGRPGFARQGVHLPAVPHQARHQRTPDLAAGAEHQRPPRRQPAQRRGFRRVKGGRGHPRKDSVAAEGAPRRLNSGAAPARAAAVPRTGFLMLNLLLALPFAAALAIALAPGVSRRTIAWMAAAAPLLGLALLAGHTPGVMGGQVPASSMDWLPQAGLAFSLRLDGLAWMFASLVLGIGALVVLYAHYYLSEDDSARRFFGYLLLFMGS